MGLVLDILKLPEPERTKAILDLDENEVYEIYSPEKFKVRVGKVPAKGDFKVGTPKYVVIRKGKNLFPLHVALKIMHKFGPTGPEQYGTLNLPKTGRSFPVVLDEPIEPEKTDEPVDFMKITKKADLEAWAIENQVHNIFAETMSLKEMQEAIAFELETRKIEGGEGSKKED